MAWDTEKFRLTYPAFKSTTLYPDEMIEAWVAMAECQLKSSPCGGEKCFDQALMMLVAHIGTLLTNAARGQLTTGAISSATIDKVSVSFQVPPWNNSVWKYWMGTTPYGQMLMALLKGCGVGGFYVGGRREAAAFRKVAGRF